MASGLVWQAYSGMKAIVPCDRLMVKKRVHGMANN